FINTLDTETIQSLALASRRKLSASALESVLPLTLSCVVVLPPKNGSDNIVYELIFSDDIHWAVRVPFQQWSDLRSESMRLDIVAQHYILSCTSVPLPRIHSYCLDEKNPLGHPYMMTDWASGVRLVDVWDDPGWWQPPRTKERFLASLARHMAELASLEFEKIGRLDSTEQGDSHFVGPFPSRHALCRTTRLLSPDSQIGPFESTHAYLSLPLDERRRSRDNELLAVLSLLLAGLPDPRFDAPPFVLGHPDFDSQNVFISEETAELSAMIDWDGVAVLPRQLGALTYPAWLTVDWNPIMYSSYKEQQHCDTEEELHEYRAMYTEAMRTLSAEYAEATRNSHILSTLAIAVAEEFTTGAIVYHLGKFAFGSRLLMYDLLEGIKRAPWFNLIPGDVARV
ncbi:hypothetical protein OE88DRAFT_1608098, partial [Heliocybe sulcata]